MNMNVHMHYTGYLVLFIECVVLFSQIASKEGYLTKLGYHRKVSVCFPHKTVLFNRI